MIPGIQASQFLPNAAVALPVATHIADFVNDTYTVNGTPVDVGTDVVDSPTGGIDASGLSIVAAQPPIPVIGAFYDRLIDFNWTMLLDLDGGNPANLNIIFTFYTLFAMPGYGYENYIHLGFGWWAEDHNSDYPGTPVPGVGSPVDRFLQDSAVYTVGLHRLGLTRTNSNLSISVDGRTALTDTTPNQLNVDTNPGADTQMQFGAYEYDTTSDETFHIAKMQIFDPVTDEELRNLTA